MSRQNMMLLYEDASRDATLSGGSFEPALPLDNLLDPDLKLPARTTDVTLASTQFKVAFDATYYSRAVVVGPANLTPLFKYRIRTYTDAGFTTVDVDTGWVDAMTDAEVRDVLAHNTKGAKLCGWHP